MINIMMRQEKEKRGSGKQEFVSDGDEKALSF